MSMWGGKFEDDVAEILTKFRKEELNYAEAITKIERLVIDCLGFGLANSAIRAEAEQDLMNKQGRGNE